MKMIMISPDTTNVVNTEISDQERIATPSGTSLLNESVYSDLISRPAISQDATIYIIGSEIIAKDSHGKLIDKAGAAKDDLGFIFDIVNNPLYSNIAVLRNSYTSTSGKFFLNGESNKRIFFNGSTIIAVGRTGSDKHWTNAPSGACNVISLYECSNITIQDVIVDGNNTPGLNGVGVFSNYPATESGSVNLINVESKNNWCSATKVNGRGIFYVGMLNGLLENCYCHHNENGIEINGYGETKENRYISLVRCRCNDNTRQNGVCSGIGVYIHSAQGTKVCGCQTKNNRLGVFLGESRPSDRDYVVSECDISHNTEQGINAGGTSFNTHIIYNAIYANGYGGIVLGDTTHVVGNNIYNNGMVGLGGENSSGVCYSDSATPLADTNSLITQNIFYDDQDVPTQLYGYYHAPIYYNGKHNTVKIVDNEFKPSIVNPIVVIPFENNVINNIIRGNIGYTTESDGESVGTGEEQATPHGLAITPTRRQVILFAGSATANPFHSSDPDATNIYVTAGSDQPWCFNIP